MKIIMSLMPGFKIGLLNAWLGIIPIILSMIIIFVPKKKALKRGSDMSSYTKKEKLRALSSTGVFYFALLYSVAVPLKIGTAWFYFGFIIYLFGIIPYIIGMHNFAATPLNEPVVKGVYRISRNPMYFFSSLTIFGMGIAGASWLMILFIIAYDILNHFSILSEEKFCFEKYGKSYFEYTQNVPRYFLRFRGRAKLTY
jgi:protein-S-isoprenylcysteine O-methyltransferase Ste14